MSVNWGEDAAKHENKDRTNGRSETVVETLSYDDVQTSKWQALASSFPAWTLEPPFIGGRRSPKE